MTTKDRILQTALRLFNEQGTDAVTVRHIAREINISHGNLCYHYPNTDAIIEGLYHQMVTELDEQMAAVSTQTLNLAMMYAVSRQSFQVFYKYKFLMLDFARIMRRLQPIRKHYQQLMRQRKDQFIFILQALVANQLLKKEQFPGQFEAYRMQTFIFGDFWIINAEILFEGSEEAKVDHYHRLYFDGLLPYLTEKGRIEYEVVTKQ